MLWILPLNDGEAVEIRRLLDEQHQRYLITRQAWGARWERLEPEITAALASEAEVVGIELAGLQPPNASNLDHHDYSDDHSRLNPLSSLEQVARIFGVSLNRWRQLVAANDRGYFPALEQELQATSAEIQAVRLQDRRAQGVTRQQELLAWDVLREIKPHSGLWIVKIPGPINSAYSDLLYSACHARQWLLQSESTWSYSGPHHRQLMSLALPEQHWAGGGVSHGFFGVQNPSATSRQLLLDALSNPL